MTDADALTVLRFLIKHDMADSVFYFDGDDGISIQENCNDLFWWASADCEEITVERLPQLERAITDCEAVYKCGSAYAGALFACRVRNMRPQNACYVSYPKQLWPLLDDAGPERATDFGNPYTREKAEARWLEKAPPIWRQSK